MKKATLTLILLVVGILAIGAYLTLFTVYQTQQALVLEFGKAKRVLEDPGLNFKIPFLGDPRLAIEMLWPVYQSLDGPQLETDWTLILGLQAGF